MIEQMVSLSCRNWLAQLFNRAGCVQGSWAL